MRVALVLPLAVLLASCGGSGGGGGDPSEALFRPDHMLEISITLAPADWELLRHEPDRIDTPRITCANQPTTRKYTYFPAEVTIDGQVFTQVAVRKKGGFGSLSTFRPALKVKANEYVPGQRILGLKRLTLNNNHQDPAIVKQCLTYALFANAGLPASRCSFAHVTVNGNDLGVYSNVESIKKDFLQRHFVDDTGNLYEGGGDFRPSIVQGLQPKVNKHAPDCSDLDPLVAALQVPDNQLEDAVGSVFSLDNFLSFWAMEVITDHWDGYTNGPNNFYVYHDPTSDRFHFIPWGVDSTFQGRARSTRPSSVFACGILPWRLYDVPATRDRYVGRLTELLDTVWDPIAIGAEINRMETLVTPFADDNDITDLAGQIQSVRDFTENRRTALLTELAGGPPAWPTPLLDPPCLIDIGSISGTFNATWGTLSDFPVGSGIMTGTMNGTVVDSTNINAAVGIDAESRTVLQIFALLPNNTYAVVVFLINDPADFVVGTLPLDLVTTAGISGFYDPMTATFTGNWLLLGGTLRFTQTSQTAGGAITGSFVANVVEL